MTSDISGSSRPNVVIADEDPAVVGFIVTTLRDAGYAVFHAYDGLSAVQLALGLKRIDLIISNTRVSGLPGVDLLRDLQRQRPTVPCMYLANIGRSSPEIESRLPAGTVVLREPFTADQLRAAVCSLVPDGAAATVRGELTGGLSGPIFG